MGGGGLKLGGEGTGKRRMEGQRTGTLTVRNMLMPFIVSFSAMSCGVETITAPVRSWVSVAGKKQGTVVHTVQLNLLRDSQLCVPRSRR